MGNKRTFEQIDQIDLIDSKINTSNEEYLINLCKQYYLQKIKKSNEKISNGKIFCHKTHKDVKSNPHLISYQSIPIYFRLYDENNRPLTLEFELEPVTNDEIQIAMELLKSKTSRIVNIRFKSSFNLNMSNKISFDYFASQVSSFVVDIQDKINGFYQGWIKSKPKSTSIFKKARLDLDDEIQIDKETFQESQWIAASRVRNYMMNDALIDYLYMYPNSAKKYCEYLEIDYPLNYNNNQNGNPIPSMLNILLKNGLEFEDRVMVLLKEKFPNQIKTIVSNRINYYEKVYTYYQQTLDAMKNNIPIIYQGVVMNFDSDYKGTYGLPDLIVRADYIDLIVLSKCLDKSIPKNKYVIVDIKNSSLHLSSDGLRLLNQSSMPSYKAQLYIYTRALGEMQNYEPPHAYILGNSYQYSVTGDKFYNNNCFGQLAVIRYDSWDMKYKNETLECIKWLRNVKTNGYKWDLFNSNVPKCKELYPNLNSTNESPWNEFKEIYAKKINDISMLPGCGNVQREFALTNGITSWIDPKCNSKTLGVTGPKTSILLDKIIDINRSEDKIIDLNSDIKLESSNLEFFVDFETIDISNDFSTLPLQNRQEYIFMIGVGYSSNLNSNQKSYKHKTFVMIELTLQEQFNILVDFYYYIMAVSINILGSNYKGIPPLYHWGCAEQSIFNRVCDNILTSKIKNSNIEKIIHEMYNQINWLDMLPIFKTNSIVIKNAFSYSLKDITNAFYSHGLINTIWDKNNPCKNGSIAMVLANELYQKYRNTNDPKAILTDPIMINIIEYNKVDCIVMYELLNAIRLYVDINI
jgi:hypothetical protein